MCWNFCGPDIVAEPKKPVWDGPKQGKLHEISVCRAIAGTDCGQRCCRSGFFVGAGDIALCGTSGDDATAKLLAKIPGTVFALGDNAYQKGSTRDYADCYGPSWGQFKNRTRPVIGNHEYMTSGAQPYLNYFGVTKNYSFNFGDWHIVSLDSNCQLPENSGSCAATSPTMKWLKTNLELKSKPCTLVMFHHPRWSSGSKHGSHPNMSAAWKIMYDAGVDVVLSGHDHDYERFAPLDPKGNVDWATGIRSFVVGTGGGTMSPFGVIQNGSQIRNSVSQGVLKLVLRATGYTWEFIPVQGGTFSDKGSDACH